MGEVYECTECGEWYRNETHVLHLDTMDHTCAFTVLKTWEYLRRIGDVRELATILGRVDTTVGIWYTYDLAIFEGRA